MAAGMPRLRLKNTVKLASSRQFPVRAFNNEDAFGADNTVAVHIRHIREKIEIDAKKPRYLKVVWGIGHKMEQFN